MKVIANEFMDKNYRRELGFGKFYLDFAWVDKQVCIEIDGQQHDRPEQQRRDIEKDQLLLENGWKVLRIRWVNMFNSPKTWIALAKEFVDNAETVPLDARIIIKSKNKERLERAKLRAVVVQG